MKKWATMDESKAGQSEVAGGSTKSYRQQHTPTKANKQRKKNGRVTKTDGGESPKTADERHQRDSSKPHPPPNQHSEAGESDDRAGQALLPPVKNDAPNSNQASPTNREFSDNSEDQTQPPLVNGRTSPGGSATKIPSNLILKVKGMAGPSTSRNEQNPLDEHDQPAGSSEVENVVSSTQSNTFSDKALTILVVMVMKRHQIQA
ncbi:MAG: hypothetical protein Q9217_006732 [Psora testacea]